MNIKIIYLIFCYWVVSMIFETINMFIAWNNFKKQNPLQRDYIITFKNMFKDNLPTLFKSIIFGPVGFLILSVINPIIFPFTIISWIKKLFRYKSESKLVRDKANQIDFDSEILKQAAEHYPLCQIHGYQMHPQWKYVFSTHKASGKKIFKKYVNCGKCGDELASQQTALPDEEIEQEKIKLLAHGITWTIE